MRVLLFKIIQWLAQHLPLSWSYAIADAAGWCQCRFSRRDRVAVTSNLTTIMSREPHQAETTRIFQRFGRYLVDFSRMTQVVNPQSIQQEVDVQGLEYVDDVLARGHGGIVLTAHFGNWEVGGAVLAQLGYPFHAIALPHSQSGLNDWFNAQRQAMGIQAIPPQHALRDCIDVLRRNELVAVVADRDFTQTGVRMRFLDRDVLMPKGAAVFAYKTGAGVIPSFYYQQEDGRWILRLMKPIYADRILKGRISDDDIKKFTQQYLNIFERMIREHPTQWLMFREYGKEV